MSLRQLAVAALALIAAACGGAGPAGCAQTLPPANVCGQQIAPRAEPPAGSTPVVLFIAPCFEAQGNQSVIEPQTYLYYIQQKASVRPRSQWVSYDDDDREDDPGRLPSPVEHELPRQPVD